MSRRDLYNKFDVLYREQHALLYAFALSKTSDIWLAEEIVQRSFIRWWEMSVKGGTGDMDAEKALFLIAKGQLIDEHRKTVAARKLLQGYTVLQDDANGGTQPMELRDIQRLIDDAISKLPARRRRIFELSRMEDLSYQEIAIELGISVSTVESQMVKAIKTLKLQLNPHLQNKFASGAGLALLLSMCY